VDILPEQNLPLLRDLVEAASLEDLGKVTGENRNGAWGPRRQLVWLAERLVRFADYFDDGERILFRLALAESEPGIANNATRIWQQLFRVHLSGTETPFGDRLGRLERRLVPGDPAINNLFFGALAAVFNRLPVRMEGSPMVAGRIVPREWQPQSRAEMEQCYRSTFELVCRLAAGADASLADRAQEFLVEHLHQFLEHGWLDQLKSVLATERFPASRLPAVIEQIENFIHFHSPRQEANGSRTEKRAYVEAVRQWLSQLTPENLSSRLLALVGRDPWHATLVGKEMEWNEAVSALARELYADLRQLEAHLPWLCSPQARSAGIFGQVLGQIDADARLLDPILTATEPAGNTALGRGYLGGLLGKFPETAQLVNPRIDSLQARAPKLAYELILAGGEAVHGVSRLLQMVESGVIPRFYLRALAYGLGRRRLPTEELVAVLRALSRAEGQEDMAAREAALQILHGQTLNLSAEECQHLATSGEFLSLSLAVLSSTVDSPGREWFSWFAVLEVLRRAGVGAVLPLAARALVSEDYRLKEQAESFLADRAAEVPGEVMAALEPILLDDRYAFHFFVDKYPNIFKAVPVAVIGPWLDKVGVEGARRIARHLPPPYVDDQERPQVPEITAYVLRRFENDERTFEEFCAGAATTDFYNVWGGKKRDGDAVLAEHFVTHPLRRIQEWARAESAAARANADRQRVEEEEEMVL
jgi:hypothetical protein